MLHYYMIIVIQGTEDLIKYKYSILLLFLAKMALMYNHLMMMYRQLYYH